MCREVLQKDIRRCADDYSSSQGAFDSMGTHNENAEHGGQALPRTTYDVKVDQQSNKPGQQAFEKVQCRLSKRPVLGRRC